MYTRDKVQQLYLATVVMKICVLKKKKSILTQTGHHISYITTTFQPLYEGKHIIIYKISKGKDTKKNCLPYVSVTHITQTCILHDQMGCTKPISLQGRDLKPL